MDNQFLTKLPMAALTAGIAFFVFGWFGTSAVRVNMPSQAVIPIEMPKVAAAGAPAAPAGPEPTLALLASADVSQGEGTVKKVCSACHSINDGGPNKIGPNLWGVVGEKQAARDGFQYSSALKGKGGEWTYATLNEWLYKPAAYAPGTKMSYAGLPNTKERANLIAYLRTLSSNPVPLPDAKQVAAAVPAAPAAAPATKTADAAPAAAIAPAAPEDFNVLLASANPDAGKADTAKLGCVACHKFNEDGKNGVGPVLYGVVGREKASYANYNYSSALKGKGGEWSYDELNAWLTKPSAYAPGTKMSYAGIADAHVRADVIAYLGTLSANPVPLPGAAKPAATDPGPAAKAPEAKPADAAPAPESTGAQPDAPKPQ